MAGDGCIRMHWSYTPKESAMKKEVKRKLSLNRETVRTLEDERLQTVVGERGPTDASACKSCINTTCCPSRTC